MKKRVALCTLGCKVNQYESEAVLEQFLKKGYQPVEFSENADVYIVNTCTVTHLSDRKSRQMIRRAKQKNPASVLVVMGCYAQTAAEDVQKIPGVDIVIGTKGRLFMPDLVEEFLTEKQSLCLVEELAKEDPFDPLTIDGSGQKHTRAYLKVQDGCNQFCSYCMIPYARGRIRSRSILDSVKEAKRLADAGFSELVLTGIHLASWGKDTQEGTLVDLLSALCEVEGLLRIRLGSLEPKICDETFVLEVSKMEKVCHHFHLSLQSGSNATLRRMNRKYTKEEYMEAAQRIYAAMPDAAITTDVIVGFPGETEEEFCESLEFVDALHLLDAHIFKYSKRSGTPAAKMENQVPPEVKEERSRKMIALSEKNQALFCKAYIGKTVEVLFEQKNGNNTYEGKTKNYIPVFAQSTENLVGAIKPVLIESYQNGALYGVIK